MSSPVRGACKWLAALSMVLEVPLAIYAERVPIAHLAIDPQLLALDGERVKPPIPIWDLSFSPDGTKLAIGAGMYLRDGFSTAVVLIVSAGRPEHVLHRFEVASSMISYEDRPSDFVWLPESDGLIVSNRRILLDLNSGSQGWLERWGELFEGMLAGRRMLTSRSFIPERLTRFSVHSADGDVLGTWSMPWLTSVSAIAATRGSVAHCQWRDGVDDRRSSLCETQLVNESGQPFSSAWEEQRAAIRLSQAAFADQDRLLCGGKYRGYRTPVTFTCWSVETGAEVVSLDQVGMWHGSPFAAGGTRVAMGDFEVTACPLCELLDGGPLRAVFRRRLVWDFALNRELVSWQPEMQTVQETWESRPRQIRYRFALSPDGRYLAEGGAGSVDVYEVVSAQE